MTNGLKPDAADGLENLGIRLTHYPAALGGFLFARGGYNGGMDETFNPPPPGRYRLPTWVKALLIIFFASAASWIVLCVIAVTWTNEEMTNYDFVAKPAQESSRPANGRQRGRQLKTRPVQKISELD